MYGSDAHGDQLILSILDDPQVFLPSVVTLLNGTAHLETSIKTYNASFSFIKSSRSHGASDIDEWQITVENNHSPVISNTCVLCHWQRLDSTGTSVATISASDAESEAITYSITAGNTGNASPRPIQRHRCDYPAAALDYEMERPSYSLTIQPRRIWQRKRTTGELYADGERDRRQRGAEWVPTRKHIGL